MSEDDKDMVVKLHYPGSKEATDKGCLCPVIDNHHGNGVPQRDGSVLFWHNHDCPMHGLDRGSFDNLCN